MGDRKKTLVILSPGFPANESDSTCVPPQQIFVKNLKQNFHDIHIVVMAFEYPFQQDEYDWYGVSVMAFAGSNKGKFVRINNWRRTWTRLKQLNKQFELIGLLSFWMGDCAFIGDRFAKKFGLKHFCWLLGQDARAGNKYVSWIKPGENSLIALSDFIAAEFYRNYGITPEYIIPPGIDPLLFADFNTGKREIDILGAGSLISLKQYDVFVKIIHKLKQSFPDIKAVICGGGPEKDRIKALIGQFRLEDNVQLAGILPHDKVLQLMENTKVFLHTSAYEGFGIVCLEALYAGAKVVSFVRPMNISIRNWHHSDDQKDMVKKIMELLESEGDNEQLYPYAISESTKAMMRLFDHNDAATASNLPAIASNDRFTLN